MPTGSSNRDLELGTLKTRISPLPESWAPQGDWSPRHQPFVGRTFKSAPQDPPAKSPASQMFVSRFPVCINMVFDAHKSLSRAFPSLSPTVPRPPSTYPCQGGENSLSILQVRDPRWLEVVRSGASEPDLSDKVLLASPRSVQRKGFAGICRGLRPQTAPSPRLREAHSGSRLLLPAASRKIRRGLPIEQDIECDSRPHPTHTSNIYNKRTSFQIFYFYFYSKFNQSVSRLGDQAVINRVLSLASFSSIFPKQEENVGGSSRFLKLGYPSR